MIHFVSNNHTTYYQIDQQIVKLEKMFLSYVISYSSAIVEAPVNLLPRGEAQRNVNNRLISLFDYDNTQQDDGYNKLDTPNKDGDDFYVVKAGRSIGIFNDWSKASLSMSGYSHSSCVKFKAYAEAQQHILKNATTTEIDTS